MALQTPSRAKTWMRFSKHLPVARTLGANFGVATLAAEKHVDLRLEVCLVAGQGIFALFQHDGNACGPIFVPKVEVTSKVDRNMPLSILPPANARDTPQALLRMPMLCNHEAMGTMLICSSPQQLYNTWLAAAQRGPVVGSLLVAIPTATDRTSEEIDTYTANTLLLAAALAPLVLQQAEHRLLQATIACGALGSAPPSGVTYIPGHGFVTPVAMVDTHSGAVANRLLHMLGAETTQPTTREDDVDSSCGSLDSINAPTAPLKNTADRNEDDAGPSSKRQRCADDAQSVARDQWDDSDDDEDVGGRSSRSMRLPMPVGQRGNKSEASPSTSQGASSCPASGEDGGGKPSTCAVSGDGLRYADAAIEGRFLVFMQQDMVLVKRFVLLCFLMTLVTVGRQLWDNMAIVDSWETRAVVLLSLLKYGSALALHSLPVVSVRCAFVVCVCVCAPSGGCSYTMMFRWSARVEQATAVLYLLLGIPNVLLQTRYTTMIYTTYEGHQVHISTPFQDGVGVRIGADGDAQRPAAAGSEHTLRQWKHAAPAASHMVRCES